MKPMKLADFFLFVDMAFFYGLGRRLSLSCLNWLVPVEKIHIRFTDFFLEIFFVGATNRGDMIHVI